VATKALPTETGSNKLGQTYGTPRQSSTRPGSRHVGSWLEFIPNRGKQEAAILWCD